MPHVHACVPLVAMTLLAGCTASRERLVLSTDLTVRKVAPGIWLHVTTQDETGGLPANGLLVETGDAVVLIDTGWNAGATERVLAFAEGTLGKRVSQAIVTHSHGDRSGGLRILLERAIPVALHEKTAALLARAGVTGPWRTFQSGLPLFTGKSRLELYYPGPGHAPDNIVVWVGRERVLFGGCLLKEEDAEDLGNLVDADLTAWAATLKRLRARYPSPRIVVPGHGEVGGRALLQHTSELVTAKTTPPP